MKMDAKFYGVIRKAKDDTLVPEDQYVVFLVKDNAFPATLAKYRETCVALGSDPEHISAVDAMMTRMYSWRAANPGLCKIPDASGEKLLV